jgi:hypothetical protein
VIRDLLRDHSSSSLAVFWVTVSAAFAVFEKQACHLLFGVGE